MACMLLLAACDNYLDIQPTGSVIPNSLAEYRALLARSYKDVSKFSDRGMACFRSDEMQVRDNEYDQNYYTSNPQLSSSASFLRLNVLSSLN